MYLLSCWYVAALAQEVTRLAPLARTFLDRKVVLFRTLDGQAAALEDRCPHRFAPLSAGKVSENGISCGYHGMSFDRLGSCTANPTQPGVRIPIEAKVRHYPLIERHGMLWIWMGEADAADSSKIPDYICYDHRDWSSLTTYLHVKANYLLLVDNLLDLTHINFVHGDVLGNPELAGNMTSTTEAHPRGLVERWFSPSAPAVPAWRSIVNAPWMSGKVDFWLDMQWDVASNMILDVGVTSAGSPRSAGAGLMNVNCITPETQTSAHYFYGAAIRLTDNVSSLPFWLKAQIYAFDQDKTLIELVQTNLGDAWDVLDLNLINNAGDRAALHARRTLRRLIERELGERPQPSSQAAE